MSLEQKNVSSVKRLCQVVNDRDYDKMNELFDTSFVDRNPAWIVTDIDELKKIISAAHEGLDMHITQDEVIATDDRVVARITFDGKHIGNFMGIPPTNKTVSWTSIELFKMNENGKVAERWVQADIAGLMRQLGVELPS